MVEVKVINPSEIDKIIMVLRNPVKYTVPAKGEIIVTLDNPEKDSIILEP